MRKRSMIRIAFSAMVLALVAGPPSFAQSIPQGLNLGFTSFLDGSPPAGPGVYYQQYLQWYTADTFRDADGDKIRFPDMEAIVSLNQLIYQSDQSLLFGGKWGLNLILPIVGVHAHEPLQSDLSPAPVTDNGAGLGDIWFGPYIQWDPVMGEDGPLFVHRIELQTVMPTGRYDNRETLNPGGNTWQFNPYWAGTVWLQPWWTMSLRFHYLWNSENTDPWIGLPPGTDDVQPGQAIHFNFATAFEVIPQQLRVGINGYFLRQLNEAKLDGRDIPDSEEMVLGIGPGAMYSFSQDDHIFVNFYAETAVENRLEGFRLVVRWVHHF